jgi:hypothetical protein
VTASHVEPGLHHIRDAVAAVSKVVNNGVHIYWEPGDPDVQVVRYGVHIMSVPLRSIPQRDDTVGVMFEGGMWLAAEPRPPHHPDRW